MNYIFFLVYLYSYACETACYITATEPHSFIWTLYGSLLASK